VIVVLVKNFRGDVVRSTEFFVEVTVRVINKRCSEVNNLNLIKLFVLLEQDILWLQVTMHNVGLMAVVDAREDLFHEDGAVTLAEFATLQDFIEELTTLADLSHKVVALLILEELVHFDDVWVIDSFENVNFVEEHTLLVVVHVALSQNFYGALSSRLSVNAHTHLTERACAKNLTNSVVITKFALGSADKVRSTDAASVIVLLDIHCDGISINHFVQRLL